MLDLAKALWLGVIICPMNLQRADLEAVRTIVVHENGPGSPCPDGVASAILLRDALPNAEVLFASYDTIAQIPPRPGTLFCDITPSAPGWREADPIVLDHHEKQRELTQSFQRSLYLSGPGISGATLAHDNVWRIMRADLESSIAEEAERFAATAAVRDSWHKDSPSWEESCRQAEALRFWPWKAWPADPFCSSAGMFQRMLAIGDTLWDKRLERSRHLADRAFYFTSSERATRVAIISSLETSDVADIVSADVLVGFGYWYDAKAQALRLTLSLRARGAYDVGALAKSLGGGGHRAAAGATIDVDSNASPYATIEDLVRCFETHQGAAR